MGKTSLRAPHGTVPLRDFQRILMENGAYVQPHIAENISIRAQSYVTFRHLTHRMQLRLIDKRNERSGRAGQFQKLRPRGDEWIRQR